MTSRPPRFAAIPAFAFRLIGLALMALTVTAMGCSQNPYPDSGRFFLEQPQKTEPEPVADIDMPAVLECEEGSECTAPIRGIFGDAGGTPILTFKTLADGESTGQAGLPAGAAYDENRETLAYVPDFTVVDPAKDPTRNYRVFTVEATLRKLQDPVTVYKRRTLLITVRNILRAIDLHYENPPANVNEGETAHGTLTINSVDFPNGPFQLSIQNAPAGVTATATSGNTFDIAYTVPYSAVSLDDLLDPVSGRYTRVFNVNYSILPPSGETKLIVAPLKVFDTRISPVVSYPPAITQGLSGEFTIRVDDLNGERAPAVQLPETMPAGKLAVTEIPLSNPGIPAHLYTIRWSEIPATEVGKTFEFPFLVCGATSPTENTQCKNYVTSITIAQGIRK